MALQGLHPVDLGMKGSEEIWGFPKISGPLKGIYEGSFKGFFIKGSMRDL